MFLFLGKTDYGIKILADKVGLEKDRRTWTENGTDAIINKSIFLFSEPEIFPSG